MRAAPNFAEFFSGLRADYSAAKHSRFRRRRTGIAPMGSSADYHYRTEADYLKVMEYSRDMDRNDGVVGQAITRSVENEIQDGFTLSPLTGDTDLNKDLAARWYSYTANADLCDLSGEHTWWEMEQLMSRSVKVDGDILGLATDARSIEIVEGHRLRTPTYNKKPHMVHGVELDGATRKPLRYFLTKDDVGTGYAVLKLDDFQAVDARDAKGERQVFHARSVKRASQTRGIGVLAPIFDYCGMHDDIEFAKLVQQQIVSAFFVFEELDKDYQELIARALSDDKIDPLPDGKPRSLEGLGPGMVFPARQGVKYKLDSPHVPNDEFFKHVKLILTIIGINLGLPVCLLLMDASETNFSGFRGALDQARMGFRANQRRLAARWHSPIYRWQLRHWMADDAALRHAAAKSDIAIFDHIWNMPTWPYIQPLQDASADLLRTRNALISQRRRCAERNMEWSDLSTEIVEDNAELIAKAFTKAQELNKKYPGLNVTWREVASLPTAEGMQISFAGEAGSLEQGLETSNVKVS